MSNMEKLIKDKTDEIVEKYKQGYAAKGANFDSYLEIIFRQGVSYGLSIASMALASLPVDVTMVDQEK